MQKKASAAEAVLTLEAVSTVKGLVGPAVKPKKRAAAKETSSSAKRSGESEKTAPKAKRRTSSASTRPRRQGIRADALIRARDRQAQESSLQEGAQALEAFDDAYPLPIFEADADPEAPRTGPAKLPDLPLIEQLEAAADGGYCARTAFERAGKKCAHGGVGSSAWTLEPGIHARAAQSRPRDCCPFGRARLYGPPGCCSPHCGGSPAAAHC